MIDELKMLRKWAKEAQDDLKNESRPARTNVTMIIQQLDEIIDRQWLLKKAEEEDNCVISVGGLVKDSE